MEEKNWLKKDWRYGAGFCTALILTAYSCGVPIAAVLLDAPSDPFFLNIYGPDAVVVNEPFPFEIEFVGLLFPIDVDIDFGNGDNRTLEGTNDSSVTITHTYPTTGNYTITVKANDSNNNIAWGQLDVEVVDHKCDLGVLIESHRYWPVPDEKMFTTAEIHTKVEYYWGKMPCEDYELVLVVNPGNITFTIEGREVWPGGHEDDLVSLDLSIGSYTASVTLKTNCGDQNDENDQRNCKFFVLPDWLCDLLKKIPPRLCRIIERLIESIGPSIFQLVRSMVM